MLNDILKFDKIFITGIFGSGKTRLAKHIIPKTHTYISFDDNYSYQKEDLEPIYKLMNKHPKFIMDALPVNRNGHDNLKNFYQNNNCFIVILKCDIDIWLDRLKSKGWHDESQISQYKDHYSDYYDKTAKEVIASFDNIFMYDST